mmetsp:Transcript_925/g.1377  ORF Transcript_925/g.1377 Transcript_925/m.1377 type:complete len:87 (-) Transcript_925:807-1067(-)
MQCKRTCGTSSYSLQKNFPLQSIGNSCYSHSGEKKQSSTNRFTGGNHNCRKMKILYINANHIRIFSLLSLLITATRFEDAHTLYRK